MSVDVTYLECKNNARQYYAVWIQVRYTLLRRVLMHPGNSFVPSPHHGHLASTTVNKTYLLNAQHSLRFHCLLLLLPTNNEQIGWVRTGYLLLFVSKYLVFIWSYIIWHLHIVCILPAPKYGTSSAHQRPINALSIYPHKIIVHHIMRINKLNNRRV